jgi:hypothetical protein
MALWWTLALLYFLSAPVARGDQARPSQRSLKDWPWKVEGLGLDSGRAKENAWKETHKQVAGFLDRQEPPIQTWRPSEAYIQKHLLDHEEAGEDIALSGKDPPFKAKRWLVFLKPPDLEAMVVLDRHMQRGLRAQERMLTLGRFGAGLVVVLAALAGYIRLDEWTRGSYTRLLQLAGVGVIAAVFAGLWLIR